MSDSDTLPPLEPNLNHLYPAPEFTQRRFACWCDNHDTTGHTESVPEHESTDHRGKALESSKKGHTEAATNAGTEGSSDNLPDPQKKPRKRSKQTKKKG